MATVKDALAFLLQNYPCPDDFSNARVTKMLYLADWHQAINYQRQLTPIRWKFDNYGPFVKEVQQEAAAHPELFSLALVPNMYGNPKMLFRLSDRDYSPALSNEEKQSLQHVIDTTSKLNWNSFIALVYSTYPIMSSERYSRLDLVQKAAEYNQLAA